VTSALIRVSLLVRVSRIKVLRVCFGHYDLNVVCLKSVPKGRWSQERRGHKVLKG
jgi:hypothetical protein